MVKGFLERFLEERRGREDHDMPIAVVLHTMMSSIAKPTKMYFFEVGLNPTRGGLGVTRGVSVCVSVLRVMIVSDKNKVCNSFAF